MSHARRFDHVGITVADLDTVTAFFVGSVSRSRAGRSWRASFWTLSAASPTPAPSSSCEHSWRMAYVRGPEGLIVSLAERIG
jgi:hypothetical protein